MAFKFDEKELIDPAKRLERAYYHLTDKKIQGTNDFNQGIAHAVGMLEIWFPELKQLKNNNNEQTK